MSSFKLSIPDYRAIGDTTIVNDGITVIAGANSSGKSTLSRLWYYLVNSLSQSESLMVNRGAHDIQSILRYIFDALNSGSDISWQEQRALYRQLSSISRVTDLNALNGAAEKFINDATPLLARLLTQGSDEVKARIVTFLQVTQQSHVTATDIFAEYRARVQKVLDQIAGYLERKPLQVLLQIIEERSEDLNDLPSNLSFAEDGVELLGKSFKKPLALRKAIYIDTPMAVNDVAIDHNYWQTLKSLMTGDNTNSPSHEIDILQRRINKVLHGEIGVVDDPATSIKTLTYNRKDGLSIKLTNAATGIKTFAYLQRLLSTGSLNNGTMLIIDEPEAHLHPQWIVECADVLVRLHAELGVKVMITSHNPDMVSALRTIAEAKNVLGSTKFYLAKPIADDRFKFRYRDIGQDISPIFESFNIALARIDQYLPQDVSLL